MSLNCNHKTCDGKLCRRPPKTPKARQPLRRTVKKPVATKKSGKDDELRQWFLDRRAEMTGWCACGCGQRSSKHEGSNYKSSIAHVLCKKLFKSIATDKDNWVELNFWDGCHTTLDNMGYDYCKRTKPLLWAIIVEKFKLLYPRISKDEIRFIPEILLKEILP